VAAILLAVMLAQGPAAAEVIAEVRIHGNLVATEAEVLAAAAIQIGAPVAAGLLEEVAARLRATGRFQRVEVAKRFASISDPSQVVIVIVVDEGPVSIERTGDPSAPFRAVRKSGMAPMFIPLLAAEDGYGFSYGVRTAIPNPAGSSSQVAFPATWGGDKRIGAILDKSFTSGPITRVEAGGHLRRRENPHFERDDDRRRIWVRGERQLTSYVRGGATAAVERVSFLDQEDRYTQLGADVVLDTRRDPFLARNAVYARAAWDRLAFRRQDSSSAAAVAHRSELEARGYLGLIGQSVLVARAVRQDSSIPLVPALRPLLGGQSSLRGFAAGSFIGDTLVAGSAELLVPLTPVMSSGRVGVSAFADVGTVYPKGAGLADQRFARGVGGSVWLTAAILQANLSVARGLGHGTRVHFGFSLGF
jgi:hypothetical protein